MTTMQKDFHLTKIMFKGCSVKTQIEKRNNNKNTSKVKHWDPKIVQEV